MKIKKVSLKDILGFFIVSIVGSICHFVYELSGKNIIAACFTPINESTWEHLKLLFFPFIIFVLIEFFIYGKNISGFLFSNVVGVLCGIIFIPCAFYLINAVFGKSSLVVDILLFLIAVWLSFRIRDYRIEKGFDNNKKRTIPAIILITGLTVLFIGFTFFPPSSPLFISPV